METMRSRRHIRFSTRSSRDRTCANGSKPEAGAAAALAPPELAEHAGRHVGRDALALVAHQDGGRVRLAERRFRRVAAQMCWFHHDSHDTSSVPDSVFHQVAENLI